MIFKTEKEFVCDRLPTENCHASTVLPLENGNVLCAWFGGTKEGSKDVDIWYTIRNKNGFTDPVRITADTGVPHWNPVLFRNNNGSIVLFFKVGNRIPRWKTYCCISFQSGGTCKRRPERRQRTRKKQVYNNRQRQNTGPCFN